MGLQNEVLFYCINTVFRCLGKNLNVFIQSPKLHSRGDPIDMKNMWVLIVLLFSFGLTGCNEQSVAIGIDEENSVDEGQVLTDDKRYSGYVASFSSEESHYDIGSSLSEVQFEFLSSESLVIHYNIHDTQIVDAQGTIEVTQVSIVGEYVELSFPYEGLGEVRLIGTITESAFTGKFNFQWQGQPASMNFISILKE